MNENTQSYEYYRLGIKYYKNIHPNKFYIRNVDGTFETKIYEEQLKLLNKIFISFNTAEYYFRKVIMEYPESEWAGDSKEKIKLLKKLYKSYENINIKENNKIIDNNKFIKEMELKILDLFGNHVGSRTSLAFFQAKALQKCDLIRKLFRN